MSYLLESAAEHLVGLDLEKAAGEFLEAGGTESDLLGMIAEAHGYTQDGYLYDYVLPNMEDGTQEVVAEAIAKWFVDREKALVEAVAESFRRREDAVVAINKWFDEYELPEED